MIVAILCLAETAAAKPPPAFDANGAPAFGNTRALRESPGPGCVSRPEHGVRWSCDVEIAGVRLQTFFIVDHHRWSGTMTTALLDEEDVLVVEAALVSTWGQPLRLGPGDFGWTGDNRIAGLHVEPEGSMLSVRIVWADPREIR